MRDESMTTEPTVRPDPRGSTVGTKEPGSGTSLPGRVTSRFGCLVGILRDFWYEDRTSEITRIAVACRLRERLPSWVPLVRGEDPGSPAVVVDGSIGIVVLEDETRSEARRRLAAAAEHVCKLVVYETDPGGPTMGSSPSLEEWLEARGVTEASFVSGGARATPSGPAGGSL